MRDLKQSYHKDKLTWCNDYTNFSHDIDNLLQLRGWIAIQLIPPIFSNLVQMGS